MDIYIYKLRFNGATHFGDTGIDLENVSETVSSDTLFSSLINVMSEMYDNKYVSEFINDFRTSPSFLISSLFVFNDKTYFLPRPMDDSVISEELKREKGKELKKLKWLNPEGFKKWLGGSLKEDDVKVMESAQHVYRQSFTVEIRPRVSLDRVNQNSSIYHCGYVYFKENAGLYGLVAFNDSSSLKLFKKLLEMLGKAGLGGERTYGCGMFEVADFEGASGTLKEILEFNTDKYTLLSLYHPAEDEKPDITNKLISYDILRKKGWISSGRYALPLKRKSLGFITEGSVLHNGLKGCIVDVTPENVPKTMLSHKVFRYGNAFTAPMRK